MLDSDKVAQASDTSRLFLVRTKGSLSGGTPVKMIQVVSDDTLIVAGRTQVKVSTAPGYKVVMEEVTVTLDDLVIRRGYVASTDPKPDKNRQARRRERALTAEVVQQLKEKYAK